MRRLTVEVTQTSVCESRRIKRLVERGGFLLGPVSREPQQDKKHGLRLVGLLFTVYGSRFTVHGSRFTIDFTQTELRATRLTHQDSDV
jgi:hypothetical protein